MGFPDEHFSSSGSRRARGHFIAFTGTDGAGKSTQAGLLARRLNRCGRQTYVAEPKDDFTTEILTHWSQSANYRGPRQRLGNETMDVVKGIDSLRDIARNVLPLLAVGINVVAPRSIYCRLALASAFGSSQLERLESLLTVLGEPELTILLDVPVAITMARIEARGTDDEDRGLMRSFGKELRILADRKAFVVVDADRPRMEVHADVWSACQRQFTELPSGLT